METFLQITVLSVIVVSLVGCVTVQPITPKLRSTLLYPGPGAHDDRDVIVRGHGFGTPYRSYVRAAMKHCNLSGPLKTFAEQQKQANAMSFETAEPYRSFSFKCPAS